MRTISYIILGIFVGVLVTLWFQRISNSAESVSEYSEIKFVSEYSDSIIKNTLYIKQK